MYHIKQIFFCLEISFVLFTSKNSLATGDRVGLIRWTLSNFESLFCTSTLKEGKKETYQPTAIVLHYLEPERCRHSGPGSFSVVKPQ